MEKARDKWWTTYVFDILQRGGEPKKSEIELAPIQKEISILAQEYNFDSPGNFRNVFDPNLENVDTTPHYLEELGAWSFFEKGQSTEPG